MEYAVLDRDFHGKYDEIMSKHEAMYEVDKCINLEVGFKRSIKAIEELEGLSESTRRSLIVEVVFNYVLKKHKELKSNEAMRRKVNEMILLFGIEEEVTRYELSKLLSRRS